MMDSSTILDQHRNYVTMPLEHDSSQPFELVWIKTITIQLTSNNEDRRIYIQTEGTRRHKIMD
jgi:hypothetical protein